MSDEQKTCESCEHFHTEKSDHYCRRFPPTPVFMPVQRAGFREPQLVLQGVMPPVNPKHRCGEWRERSPEAMVN